MNDAEIKLKVSIDETSASKQMDSLGSKADALSSKFKNAGKGLTLGLTVPIAGLIGVGVKYNATVETLTSSFETMTGSADEAGDVVERLKKIGSKTPFEFTELAETTKLLMNYGLTSDEAIDKMQMLGDISQGNADKMSRVSMAYGQMSSASKVSLEDVKQMIEAGFNPLKEISETTGESMTSLYDRISKGSISVDEITASMQRSTSEGGKYFGSMETQSQTTTGKLSTLKDEFLASAGTLTESLIPVLQDVVGWLTKFSTWLGTLDEDQLKMILTIGLVIAALGPALLVLGNLITVIKGVSVALNFLAMNPIILVIAAIIIAIVLLITHFDTVKRVAKNVADAFVTSFNWLKNKIGDILKAITNTFNKMVNNLIGGINLFIKNALAPLNLLIKGINIPLKALGLDTISQIKIEIPKIPMLETGTNFTQEGLHYLHQGEAVVPKKYNPAAGGNGAGGMNTIYVQVPNIELDGRVVSRGLTPYITQTVKMGGGNL